MTKKIYKTARGKTVDLGALILQNESVRAVGNMNVNARGDVLDSADRVIDPKNNQIQRQHDRTIKTNVSSKPVHTSSREAKQSQTKSQPEILETVLDTAPMVEPVETVNSGLAAAIARSRQTGVK